MTDMTYPPEVGWMGERMREGERGWEKEDGSKMVGDGSGMVQVARLPTGLPERTWSLSPCSKLRGGARGTGGSLGE